MTESVKEIGKASEICGNHNRDKNLKRGKGKKQLNESKDDCVDISEEARDRASGRKRGNILEYLENEI